ncbi:hypothetical protein V6N12_056472 [Hibiscus sabdariffa]|uniref:Uncharacterized protein n=1 Tax=Hibiscus sabdariffa TaxID=183260 RepID=A0ABR2CV55_9ROSI
MSQNLKGIQTNQEACSTDKKPSYREIVKRNLEEYGSEASSSHIADTAEPSNREQKSSSDKVYKRIEVGNELFMVRVLELGFQVAGGSEGIKVHCRDSLKVTEDSSSEVSGKSPASKGTNLCSNEDEEAEEWHNGNFVNNGGDGKRMYRWKILGGRRISREIRGRRKHQTVRRFLSFVDVATSWLSVLRKTDWLVKLSSRNGGEGL